MATTREIRRHIRSVRSISQVTRAMQMVAAAKMRRAQAAVLATRPYSQKAWELLTFLAAQAPGAGPEEQPLLTVRPARNIGLVMFTGDRGMCGGYNHNLIRRAVEFVDSQTVPISVITVGRKGRDLMLRLGKNVIAEYHDLGAQPSLLDVLPIARIVIDDYTQGVFDRVYIAYTQFVNTLVQRVVIRRLLPIRVEGGEEDAVQPLGPSGRKDELHDFIFEPDARTVLGEVLPRFTEVQVYQAALESIASEESARMVAMRNATDNARDLLGRLTLTYNQVRQSVITKEMLDIAAGGEALAKARAGRV